MPLYDYYCECGHLWDEFRSIYEDSMTSICPECNDIGKKQIGAPGLLGMDNPVKHTRYRNTPHQVEILRPRPFDDAKSQLARIESDGNMTPELKAHGKFVLDGLKSEKLSGKHNVDYWSKGHPMEVDTGPRAGVLDE